MLGMDEHEITYKRRLQLSCWKWGHFLMLSLSGLMIGWPGLDMAWVGICTTCHGNIWLVIMGAPEYLWMELACWRWIDNLIWLVMLAGLGWPWFTANTLLIGHESKACHGWLTINRPGWPYLNLGEPSCTDHTGWFFIVGLRCLAMDAQTFWLWLAGTCWLIWLYLATTGWLIKAVCS